MSLLLLENPPNPAQALDGTGQPQYVPMDCKA